MFFFSPPWVLVAMAISLPPLLMVAWRRAGPADFFLMMFLKFRLSRTTANRDLNGGSFDPSATWCTWQVSKLFENPTRSRRDVNKEKEKVPDVCRHLWLKWQLQESSFPDRGEICCKAVLKTSVALPNSSTIKRYDQKNGSYALMKK